MRKFPGWTKFDKMILKIGYNDWQKIGYSKGTLPRMKKNVARNKPFPLNKQMKEQLDPWEMER